MERSSKHRSRTPLRRFLVGLAEKGADDVAPDLGYIPPALEREMLGTARGDLATSGAASPDLNSDAR
jgi:hypothetical protein